MMKMRSRVAVSLSFHLVDSYALRPRCSRAIDLRFTIITLHPIYEDDVRKGLSCSAYSLR